MTHNSHRHVLSRHTAPIIRHPHERHPAILNLNSYLISPRIKRILNKLLTSRRRTLNNLSGSNQIRRLEV